jgi:hypothetical protein
MALYSGPPSLTVALLLIATTVSAQPITPNFTQGVLNSHTETRSTVNEDIKSFDMRTGYQFTVGGENVQPSTTNIAPEAFNQQSGSVQGTATTYVLPDLSNKPEYTIVEEGAPFSYYETLETPGIQNYTHIIRTTEIEQITDTTSTFQ